MYILTKICELLQISYPMMNPPQKENEKRKKEKRKCNDMTKR